MKKTGEKRTVVSADTAGSAMAPRQSQKGNAVLATVCVLLVVALLGLAAWMLFMKDKDGNAVANGTATVASTALNKEGYQAVFLSNGQVYFGKLQNTTGDSLVLKDIYYLQVDSAIQPSSGDESEVSTTDGSDGSNVQLIKLGNELHGPEDQMQIMKDQVLFWENIKKDGKVSKAIASYTKK